MKIVSIIIALCVFSAMITGCDKKDATIDAEHQQAPIKPAAEASETETQEEFEEVFIEDKEIDVGTII